MLSWTSKGRSELRIRAEFGSNVPVASEKAFGYWIDYATSVAFKDGESASAALERLAAHPESIIQVLRQTNPPRQVMEALDGPIGPPFAQLRPTERFDARPSGPEGTKSPTDLGKLQVAVSNLLTERRASASLLRSTADTLRRVPMQPGYAAAVKGLIKLSTNPQVFGTAAGRIASGDPRSRQSAAHQGDPVPRWILVLVPEWVQPRKMTRWGLTQDSVDYLNRLVRRRFKEWGGTDRTAYVKSALALLGQLDSDGGIPGGRERAFAANYLLYGRVVRDTGHGRHEQVPPEEIRQSERFEAHPEIWDSSADAVAESWAQLRNDVDTFVWMTLVLGAERARLLQWSVYHVDLALRSSNRICQALAREQLDSRGVDAFRPEEADPAGWRAFLRLTPGISSFTIRRDAIDLAASALRPGPGASWSDWIDFFSIVSVHLDGVALERLAKDVLGHMRARTPSSRRSFVARLIRSGHPASAALGWLAVTQAAIVRVSPEEFVAGIPHTSHGYTWHAFTPLSEDISDTGLCALQSGVSAQSLWPAIALACTPEEAGGILRQLVPSHPELARLLWRHLDDEVMESAWVDVEQGPLSAPLREAIRAIGPRGVVNPGTRQRAFLERWMRAEAQDWLDMRPLLEAVIRSGDPTLVPVARDLVLKERAMDDFWLALAESQSPAAVPAVIEFLSVVDSDRRSERVLALLDSPVTSARQLGWSQYSALPEEERLRVTEFLLESRDSDVVDRVARILDGTTSVDAEALRAFDRSVLLSRRTLRSAKEAVQRRWESGDHGTIDRAVLNELALATTKADADWAWRQLARLDALVETAGSTS